MAKTFHDSVRESILDATRTDELHPFYLFEPWDVKPRSPEFFQQAMHDNVDLQSPELQAVLPPAPHDFQSALFHNADFIALTLAATQTGKSWAELHAAIAALTGEIPLSLRYDRGFVTEHLRPINRYNILIHGRRDKRTGEVLDHNPDHMLDPQSWNCGYITGAGKMNPKLICPNPGDRIWIGTGKEHRNQFWWPRLKEILPPSVLDTTRGTGGFSEQGHIAYLVDGMQICIITYEQQYTRFEARKVWWILLDEEPPDRRVWTACLTHCNYLRMSMTPYNGLSWTYTDIFRAIQRGEMKIPIYHATKYDCPFETAESISELRGNMEDWEIGARIYGLHTEATGAPYFDRNKLNGWIRREAGVEQSFERKVYVPSEPYFEAISNPGVSDLPGLLDITVSERTFTAQFAGGKFHAGPDDAGDYWKIYEPRREGACYYVPCDCSEGGDEYAADLNASLIMRKPMDDEDPKWPIICASMITRSETDLFAQNVMLACRYWSNALLCAETRRAAANATFYSAAKSWPFWFLNAQENRASRKVRQVRGWDTSAAVRESIFGLMREYIGERGVDETSGIPVAYLLEELAGCVVGKNFRPDHTTRSTLDVALAWGIGLWIYRHESVQITDRSEAATVQTVTPNWMNRMLEERPGKTPKLNQQPIRAYGQFSKKELQYGYSP